MSTVRRLGLGLAALGRPAYINVGRATELPADRGVDELRKATWQTLDAAYEAGIRWVDAARSYGRSEEFLAGWLDERGVDDVTVSSKWGYAYVGEWRMDAPVHEAKEHTLTRFRTQVTETRGLLGDRVALYQVHSLTADSSLFEDLALQRALAESGLRLGFSTSGPRQPDTIRRALDLHVDGRRLFTAVQSTWNVLESSATEALREAHAGGAHVLLKETLANGRLATQPPPAVSRVAARHDVAPDAVAVAAALSRPWVDTVLVGAVSPAQLHSNHAAVSLRLTEDDLAELADEAQPPDDYWQARAALPWI